MHRNTIKNGTRAFSIPMESEWASIVSTSLETLQEATLDFVRLKNGPVDLNVAVAGDGPLIVCVHGFPEL